MKRLFIISLLSIMFISVQSESFCTFQDNQCINSAPNKVKCEVDNADSPSSCVEINLQCQDFNTNEQSCLNVELQESNKRCFYNKLYYGENDFVEKCLELTIDEDCNFNKVNKDCSHKEEGNYCTLYIYDEYVECIEREAECYDFESSKEGCLSLVRTNPNEKCGYDARRPYNKCYNVYIEDGCTYDNRENKCSISTDSNEFVCELVTGDNVECKTREALCSDFDQDMSKCLGLTFQEGNKKCSYDSSRSSGNKCFEVLSQNGCAFDNSQKKCTGNDLSNGKICDLDFSMSPVTCDKRNAQCIDFNGDQTNCGNVILQDITKECSYDESASSCLEKMKEAKCTFNEGATECTSSLLLKIKCEVNAESNGCIEQNVECSDFESNGDNCNKAVISDSKKKCKYDGTKDSDKCYEAFKECSDLYNEQDCNNYKPQNKLSKCLWSTDCKEKKCQTTNINNCGSFIPNDSQYQCTLNTEKTQCEEKLKPKEQTNGAEKLSLFLLITALLIIV